MASNFSSPPPECPLRIEATVLPAINYALQQNGACSIQSISIENCTDEDMEHVQLRITSNPEFTLPFTHSLDCLPARKKITLSQPKLLLDTDYLGSLTERVNGTLQLSLEKDGEELACQHTQITVFAFDEWHGLSVYPEFLVSFVTPNHPEIAKLLSRATDFLGDWTGDTSMDGYLSEDPNRVLSQAAAIFTAIKEQSIAYAVPPASFERLGQRVRLCDMVLHQKLGTCLDLTLLYAACLEAAGLNPLMIATTDHIFTGVWLENQMFPECVQDDISQITKRIASGVNQIAIVETTCVTTANDCSFDQARAVCEQYLTTHHPECIIDVRRARLNRVLPLPQRVHSESGWTIKPAQAPVEDTGCAPQALDETVPLPTPEPQENVSKMTQWERKLLDLSLRNSLLNLRTTRTQLPILTHALEPLAHALEDGKTFSILPCPLPLNCGEVSFEKLKSLGSSEMIRGEFENRRLHSLLNKTDLNKRLKDLHRTARTALEENGANSLYLALGTLRWYETKNSSKARYAPVILVPIELVKGSAAQGYAIRPHEEEARVNVTLLEKLKQEHGLMVNGLDPLPCSDHGIDVRKTLALLRSAVMAQPHWDVLETACIGIFSFSQFVMWHDLRSRSAQLTEHKLVRSLIQGHLTWDAQPLDMNAPVDESAVLLPMPADASQLYAISVACDGKTFVLHGPPGTGKSQTITSLIANALAQGKRVLFVAEKMAALEVVQKRLEQLGIGVFCLELHSNKAKKREVLEQLRRAVEVTEGQSPEAFAEKAQQLADMRAQLDTYADQLHAALPCGSSLFLLISDYENYRDAQDLSPFSAEFLSRLDRAAIRQLHQAVRELAATGAQTGHPHAHPLRAVSCSQYSQSLRSRLQPVIHTYQDQLRGIMPAVEQLCSQLDQPLPSDFETLVQLSSTAEQLNLWYDMPPRWAQAQVPHLYFDEVIRMARHFLSANALERALLHNFDPGFLSLNAEQLCADYAQACAAGLMSKTRRFNSLLGQVNAFSKVPVTRDTLRGHIFALRDYQSKHNAACALLERHMEDLDTLYRGINTDWESVAALAAAAQLSARTLYSRYGSYHFMHRFCGVPQLQEPAAALCRAMPAFTAAREEFDTLLGILPQKEDEEDWLKGQLRLCQTILDHKSQLKEWISYMGAARNARQLGLDNVVDRYQSGMEHDALFPACQKALLQGLICQAIDRSSTLNLFSGAAFDRKVTQYRQMDQEWSELARQEICCRIASRVPTFAQDPIYDAQMTILQRCIRSGGRGTSLRKLFEQIPDLLTRLCPCMLMSPLSAAQYLSAGQEPFDIVVFDEASQLPTCKAVGALSRGKEAVIVGDPNQLPPTTFFTSSAVDENNLDTEDLDSILDDCLALNVPQSHLLWHYRSRHESLIAFSNHRFYENKLLTFPSPGSRTSRVRFVPVEGVFDRGKTRRNRAEAEAVVQELTRRCHDRQLCGKSVGVITFNAAQQELIEDLLSEACAGDPELERWAFSGEEPVFIKNLENVQGDERDVILFSVGYGPDESGRTYLNFGPLNRSGGWRRLNVAVSRARWDMVVFSSLQPEHIDLTKSSAEGVAALRAFLEYARDNTLPLDEHTVKLQQQSRSDIARAICHALAQHGYHTEMAAGCSEYRIDVAVTHPQHPNEYLLGIMLDGSGYRGAKTTRDRELAHTAILKELGWNVLRVWCMDWWDDRDKELQRILTTLATLQQS